MDTLLTLAKTILRNQSGTEVPTCNDTQFTLWRKILKNLGGTVSPNDTYPTLLRKVAIQFGANVSSIETELTLLNKIAVEIGATPTTSESPFTLTKKIALQGFTQIPVIISPLTASIPIGEFFTYQIIATNEPTDFTAVGLPAGLSVNTSTGLISGTATEKGFFPVQISAGNAAGFDTKTLNLTIQGILLFYITPPDRFYVSSDDKIYVKRIA